MFKTVLRIGSTGEDVRRLQTILNKDGYVLTTDGSFGGGTLSAVKSFQKQRGLTADGVVGINTMTALKKLSDRKYSIMWHRGYIQVISFPKFSNPVLDVIDPGARLETIEQMYRGLNKKPMLMFNGSLFDMKSGATLSRVVDDKVVKGYGYYSIYGLRYDEKTGISFTNVWKDAKEFVGFSPALVIDGVRQTERKDLDNGFINNLHPRTAFAESVDAYHIIMAHGRRSSLGHRGMTINELKDFCINDLRAFNAGNFDGGGSSIILNEIGKPINKFLEKRKIDNAVAIYI